MCLATNIARRAGSASYYARLGVPKDLREVMGKRELWQSLGTKNAREAKARVSAVLAGWHEHFAELRSRREARPVGEGVVQAATWEHYQNEFVEHRIERQKHATEQDIEAARNTLISSVQSGETFWPEDTLGQAMVGVDLSVMRDMPALQAKFRAARKRTIEQHLARGETVLVRDAVNAYIARTNLKLSPGTAEYRNLCQSFQRAELEALRRAEEQDRGDYTGRPTDPAIKAPKKASSVVAAAGESVLELFDTFARENPKGVKPDTLRMNREIIVWFTQHVGPTFPASAIDKKAVREWKQALAKLPIKAAEIREFRGLSFSKIIALNDTVNRPTLSDRTVNKYLSALGAYCQWLMQNGHIDTNPVDGMHLGKYRGPAKVRPYTSDQLRDIFASPLFTGAESEEELHKAGKVHIRDHRYWLPLMSLFTGARMGELAQLLVADVRQDRGRWIIHITREGDIAKTTKTKGSQRVLPVHSELERLGFIEFHASSISNDNSRLFPEIKPDSRGQLAGHYSRFWGRYVKRIGVKNDATINFHSFRHGMADALRRAGYRDEEFGYLLGHTKATTTGRYGILTEGDLAQRCKMIDAVMFPSLDLKHLYSAEALNIQNALDFVS